MQQESMTIPLTRQGVRDLNSIRGRRLPVRGGPAPASPVNVGDAERMLSAGAGGVLARTGIRGGVAGLAALLAGGALLYRGITGHCSLYQAMGHSTARQADQELHAPRHQG
jgi:uncharacterized membrane protein